MSGLAAYVGKGRYSTRPSLDILFVFRSARRTVSASKHTQAPPPKKLRGATGTFLSGENSGSHRYNSIEGRKERYDGFSPVPVLVVSSVCSGQANVRERRWQA